MHKLIVKIIYITIFIEQVSFSTILASSINFNNQFINAAMRAKPSVVNIIIYNKSIQNGKSNFSKLGYGSGTIISENGYIVTNYHVVKKGNYFQIIQYDGNECKIKLFSNGKYYIADKKTDIALLLLEEANYIQPILFEDSNNLSEGEWVMAIGNPYGLRQSISSGIVSSRGRNDIGFADIEDFIQTDVPINPGNSGGPLINLQGKLVGINTAIRTISGGYQGISFAIPSNIIKQVCSELIRFKRVRRGWLGFLAREKKIFNAGENYLVEIISVIKNSPAAISGIQKGDIIKKIDGERIYSLGKLVKSIGNKHVNSQLKILISRDGELHEFQLTLIEKQVYQKIQKGLDRLFTLYGIEVDENVRTGDIVISYLSPMGIAYQNGLQKGDLIKSLNGKNIYTLKNFIKLFFKFKSNISIIEIYRNSTLYTIKFSDYYN